MKRHRGAKFGLAFGLILLSGGAPSGAEETARLPRPRPPVDFPQTETRVRTLADWAEGAEVLFQNARAETDSGAAKEVALYAAVPNDLAELAEENRAQHSGSDGAAGRDTRARIPRPRPPDASAELALNAPDEEVVAVPMVPPRIPETRDAACIERLEALGVVFTEEAPIDPDGLCYVDHPLRVTSLGSDVLIQPEAIMNCRTAEALALWMTNIVAPAARKHLDTTPTKLVHGSTYVCRTRNNEEGAKLSEHAHANAIDISAIAFSEREPLAIGAQHGAVGENAFEATIRQGSCTYFMTVLGPGSNAAHAEHFHFDMAERRGGYRLCELEPTSTARAP